MLRKEACSGNIADIAHVGTNDCLADCLTKTSANSRRLRETVMTGNMHNIDCHLPFRELVKQKAYMLNILFHSFSHLPTNVVLCFLGEVLTEQDPSCVM